MSLKVLLADDSMTAQNMGKKILSDSGYEVTTVSNGAAAVKKIAEIKPDLVILDIYMPGYTGLEVCERVRASLDTANMPVLLTVGKMEPYRVEDGAKVRADGVIVKPFEATDLLAVVNKLAERVVPAQRVRAAAAVAEAEPADQFEETSSVEPSMPAHVEVPSEMAIAPALGIEELEVEKPTVQTFAGPVPLSWLPPAMAADSGSAEIASVPFEPSPAHASRTPEVAVPAEEASWSFEPAVASVDVEAVPPQELRAVEVEVAPAVEFTSAPQVGDIEVAPVPELETGIVQQELAPAEFTEPALASAQEMTAFVTSFGTAQTDQADSSETSEQNTDVARDNWDEAQAEAGAAEAEPAKQPSPTGAVDEFEARVAAAMSGFATEPVEVPNETPAGQDGIIQTPADDFESRVAAAMSGFATVAPEVVSQVHPAESVETVSADDFEAKVAAAMNGFENAPEPVATELPEVTETAAPASADDFDARLAEAMAAFDRPAEEAVVEATPEPELKSKVNLDETMVLPQEAVLSLEEEMRRSMAEPHAELQPETPVVASTEAAVVAEETRVPELAWTPTPNESAAPEEVEKSEPAQGEAAVPSATAEASAPSGEKFAEAVHRAIERLKPQLIAEIVKELKGE